jgi:type III pantothenate kinase
MKLLFDLGNSRCKWALLDPVFQPGGAFEYGADFLRALDSALGHLPQPAQAIAVSVTGSQRLGQLNQWLQSRWAIPLVQVNATKQQCGVENSYQEVGRLGADRWAALIAARRRITGAVCVADCGTAVTIDALDATGLYRGGVILPGLVLQRQALTQGTQQIAPSSGQPDRCLARTTADGVASGTLYGLVGAIDRILDEQSATLGIEPVVLITGGDAPAVRVLLRHVSTHAPDLVLEGVARIAEQTP